MIIIIKECHHVCSFEGAAFKVGDWSNGMIGVSKTFGGSSILSSPVRRVRNYCELFFCLHFHSKYDPSTRRSLKNLYKPFIFLLFPKYTKHDIIKLLTIKRNEDIWMTLLNYLENDKEALITSLENAGSPEAAAKVLDKRIDRLLYQYNEESTSKILQSSAASMLETLKSSTGFITAETDAEIWDRHTETVKKKKPSVPGIAFLAAGLVLVLVSLVLSFTLKSFFTEIAKAPLQILMLSAGVVCLFFAGRFFYPKEKINRPEQYVEIRLSGKSLYRTLRAAVLVIDRNLLDLEREEQYKQAESHKALPAETKINMSEIDLLSGLLEAAYSKDGDFALERISDVKYYLHSNNIDVIDMTPENQNLFDIMPSLGEGTLRPALVYQGKLLKKGLAAGGL